MKLLTAAASNTKTAKNASQGNYLSYILHLAPAKLSGHNTCPAASAGCAAACLNTAGRGQFTSTQVARIKKTKRFFEQRAEFLLQLEKDLDAVMRKSIRQNSMPVVRLNGTSDLPWETFVLPTTGKNVFESYPAIQFYDYTKLIGRLKRLKLAPIGNYHVTFSRSEDNSRFCTDAIELGFNVAVVFNITNVLPLTWAKRPVVDGDTHDLRFLDLSPADGKGAIIALKAKGKAKKDASGFVKHLQANCGQKAG